jgi:phosphomannomutase
MVGSPLMISVSGVRGIVGESLTSEVVLRWAEAFGFLCRPGPVVVGGDSRISKVMMRSATFAGLSGAGCDIIDVGVVPTPTIGLAVEHHRARGGIALTASHNPIEWNALKFFDRTGLFLGEEDGQKLREVVESELKYSVPAVQIGRYRKDDDAVRRHVEAVLSIPFLQQERMKERGFSVGVDAVQGAGGRLLHLLLTELGCKISGFHMQPTGVFPRHPEPVAEHLTEVCAAMKRAKVEIGFALDPDADRLAVILEDGTAAGEELTVVAAADITLRHARGPVVTNCATTRALDDVAARFGVRVERTKIGEAHVARRMKEVGAIVGGEGNGGVMLPAVHAARDSAVGVALILQALLEHGGTASDYFHSLPRYHIIKRRVIFSDLEQRQRVLQNLENRVPLGEPDRLDGLTWEVAEGWVQARASNTEPVVRVYAEAQREEDAERLAAQVLRALQESL